jgi:hypothetical protein
MLYTYEKFWQHLHLGALVFIFKVLLCACSTCTCLICTYINIYMHKCTRRHTEEHLSYPHRHQIQQHLAPHGQSNLSIPAHSQLYECLCHGFLQYAWQLHTQSHRRNPTVPTSASAYVQLRMSTCLCILENQVHKNMLGAIWGNQYLLDLSMFHVKPTSTHMTLCV